MSSSPSFSMSVTRAVNAGSCGSSFGDLVDVGGRHDVEPGDGRRIELYRRSGLLRRDKGHRRRRHEGQGARPRGLVGRIRGARQGGTRLCRSGCVVDAEGVAHLVLLSSWPRRRRFGDWLFGVAVPWSCSSFTVIFSRASSAGSSLTPMRASDTVSLCSAHRIRHPRTGLLSRRRFSALPDLASAATLRLTMNRNFFFSSLLLT